MSLKISKSDLSWSRSQKAFPVFVLLWAGGILLALTYLLSARSHLQSIERSQVDHLLEVYLNLRSNSSRIVGYLPLRHDQLPDGVLFARIVHQGEQLLVVSDTLGDLSFKALVDLAPDSSGVWVKVKDTESESEDVLTVVTKRFNGDSLVQLGKDGSGSYRLFSQMIRSTVYIMLSSVALLWPLSLYFIKLSLSPLIATREKVAELSADSKTELLPEKGSGPELDNLYRQINNLLQQNRHLVSEMQNSLDNVAHDLRTPMTRLRSVAEYGLQAEGDPERLQDALSDCLEESDRVLAMLRIMMSVAEAESGTMRLERQECDLRKSLEQVVTLYEYVAQEQNVDVILADFSSLSLELDSTRISQVWANLLDNAIKYGHDGGWVKITVSIGEKDITVSLTDNGMGISSSEQKKIWERLYRGDRSRSQKGLGLGLNYVQAVVVAHGGEVSVESSLNEGSCFQVSLPLNHVSTQEKSQTRGEWSESLTSGI
ncbi:MAG: signal transduction histidine kinase [Desulforhopalus sp.]|jgi:signal transduction histidine kinase